MDRAETNRQQLNFDDESGWDFIALKIAQICAYKYYYIILNNAMYGTIKKNMQKTRKFI